MVGSVGVIEATVAAMRALGATQIRAVIGPSISQRAYEVGQDFMEDFLLEDPDYHRFFAGGPNGKPMFDLPSFGLSRLRGAGVEADRRQGAPVAGWGFRRERSRLGRGDVVGTEQQ